MTDSAGIPQEDVNAMHLIWQMRIYDMLAVIARGIDKEAADSLIEMHANGKTLGPPPVYVPDEEEP